MSKRLNHPILENYKNGLMITYPVPNKQLDLPRRGIVYDIIHGAEDQDIYKIRSVELDEKLIMEKYQSFPTGEYWELRKEFLGEKLTENDARKFIIKTAMQEVVRAANFPYSEREFLDKRNGEERLVRLRSLT